MEDFFKTFSVNLDLESKVDYTQYKDIVKENISTILRHHFSTVKNKQYIVEHHDRISFACPICDDSASDHSKKRGNFILKGKYANHIKCFNCGYFAKVEDFFKKYQITLDLNVINYIAETTKELQRNVVYESTFLFDTHLINELSFDREDFKKFFRLYEVDGTFAEQYMRKRLIYDNERFLYDIKNNELVILNLTDEKKILGFQRRSFNKNSKAKYRTFKLSKIYDILKIEKEIPDDIDALSTIFNACIVDWGKPVTAFEGPIDSFLYKNSVAITGVHKGLKFDMYMRYWMDKDEAGIKKSIELISEGKYVFLWSKFMMDYDIPNNRKKWDFNDLLIYLRERKIIVKNFNAYFSNTSLDIIDI